MPAPAAARAGCPPPTWDLGKGAPALHLRSAARVSSRLHVPGFADIVWWSILGLGRSARSPTAAQLSGTALRLASAKVNRGAGQSGDLVDFLTDRPTWSPCTLVHRNSANGGRYGPDKPIKVLKEVWRFFARTQQKPSATSQLCRRKL